MLKSVNIAPAMGFLKQVLRLPRETRAAGTITTAVLYGIFSSENSYPCAVTYSVRSHFFNFPNLIFCNIRIIELLKYICCKTDGFQAAHIVFLIDLYQL